MFFLVLYLSLTSLSSLPVWREDARVFLADRGSGVYGTSAYVVSVVLFDIVPYRLIAPALFAGVSYPMIGLNPEEGRRKAFGIILALANLANTTLMVALATMTNSNSSANTLGSIVMLLSILFSGFLLNRQRVPVGFRWLQQWSPGQYLYEALVVNEFETLDGLYITTVIGNGKNSVGPFTGEEIMHCFGYHSGQYGHDAAMLTLMTIGYIALTLVVVKFFVRESR